jgi:hypothetical protein
MSVLSAVAEHPQLAGSLQHARLAGETMSWETNLFPVVKFVSSAALIRQ